MSLSIGSDLLVLVDNNDGDDGQDGRFIVELPRNFTNITRVDLIESNIVPGEGSTTQLYKVEGELFRKKMISNDAKYSSSNGVALVAGHHCYNDSHPPVIETLAINTSLPFINRFEMQITPADYTHAMLKFAVTRTDVVGKRDLRQDGQKSFFSNQ